MAGETFIAEITTKLVAALHPDKVILFGSHARGAAAPASDVDLLVVMRTSMPRPQRTRLAYSAVYPYSVPLDLLVCTPEEVSYWQDTPASLIAHVLREGKVLYERA